MPYEVPDLVARRLVTAALAEDLGGGDVTSEACVPAQVQAVAHGMAREPLVVAGVELARLAFTLVDAATQFEIRAENGTRLERGATVFTARGSARSLLAAERVALNLVQRASGVATATRRFVDALAPGSSTRITDTRKTTPGLRLVERCAVRAGGGHNHRNDLASAVLIKDNHIVAAGGIGAAIAAARAYAPHTSRIECEVDDLEGLEQALAAGAEVVLLDNMDNALVAEALRRNAGRALLEASGNVTLERVRALSELGVHAISVGALTHSVRAVDLGLDFEAS